MFQLVTPGAGPVLTQRALYELGRGPQGDAKNKISKLYAFQFQRRKILKMGFFVPVSTCDPHGMGQILTQGATYEQTW